MTTDVTFDLRHLDFLVFFFVFKLGEELFVCGKKDVIKRPTVDAKELSKSRIFFIKSFIKILMLCLYCVSIAMKAFHFVMPFCFSYVLRPPMPNIPPKTVKSVPMSNSGNSGISMPPIEQPNIIKSLRIK